MDRRDRAVYRCRLLSDLAAKPREVPHWMFDNAACCVMQACEQPRVSVIALQRLVQLLGPCVLERQHLPLVKGDADEPRSRASDDASATGPVYASPNVPRWSHLTWATRQTIETHMATLIRQHAARLRNGKEADDER